MRQCWWCDNVDDVTQSTIIDNVTIHQIELTCIMSSILLLFGGSHIVLVTKCEILVHLHRIGSHKVLEMILKQIPARPCPTLMNVL